MKLHLPFTRPQKLIFTSFDTYGDLVLEQPMFSALIEAGHKIMLLIREQYTNIIPYIDPKIEVIATSIDPVSPKVTPQLIEWLLSIAKWEPHAVICPKKNVCFLDSIVMRYFAEMRIPQICYKIQGSSPSIKYGLHYIIEDLCDHFIEVEEWEHETVSHNRCLLKLIGKSLNTFRPRLLPSTINKKTATTLRQQLGLIDKKYFITTPAGTVNCSLKAWPLESFISTTVKIHREYGLTPLLIGVKQEEPHLKIAIKQLLKVNCQAQLWIGDKQSLNILLKLIAESECYIGPDTGLMHFSAALDKPVLGIFGGGTWGRFFPIGRKVAVITQKLPCFHCGWNCSYNRPYCLYGISQTRLDECIQKFLEDVQEMQYMDLGRPPCSFTSYLLSELKVSHSFIKNMEGKASCTPMLSERI